MSAGASQTPVNHADVAGAISSYYGVMSSDSRIQQLLGVVLPDVERAAANNPMGSWRASLTSVIQRYESLARDLGLGVSQTQRDIEAARHANRTDATFAGVLGRLGWNALQHYAMLHGGSGEGGSGRSGESGTLAARAGTGNAGGSSAPPSFAAMQQISAYGRMSGTDFAAHLGFHGEQARELGGALANTSGAFRRKVADYKRVMDDPNATPEQKKDAADAMQKSAKTKRERDAVGIIQKTIEKMKANGVDGQNKEEVDKYIDQRIKDHPSELRSLDADRKRNNAKDAGLTDKQLVDAKVADARKAAAAAPKHSDKKHAAPVPQTL
jgi:hypothetical protein